MSLDKPPSQQQSQREQNTSIVSANANLDEIFREYQEEILIYMKKYQEAYNQSELGEKRGIEDLIAFQTHVRDYEAYLNQKLKSYKETIAKFSKILNIQL